MNRRMGLLSIMLFATACGPESAADETNKETSASELKTSVSQLVDPPVVTFWEGNGCSQDQVGWYIYNNTPMIMPNSGGSGWVNDEARSMMLFRMPANTIVRVYNSGSGSHSEDWAEIVVKEYADQLCIHSFEDAVDNAAYSLRYCRYNGDLDGKVSQARIQGYPFNGDTCNGTWMPW
ncbi:hypothetical protein JQX13_20090 [Archangium violaceum]|uniref:hypothetical protein n=1 Tax=Archangium violaceum TaxID=83451 RepID=UPI00193B3FE6|nr:hypothetical protein [Archangium violaceum]QRK12133.1 hypothetical protein JQX13_20090 [Archangium violaceum]